MRPEPTADPCVSSHAVAAGDNGLVSVVLCTRDRPEDACRAIASLLDSPTTSIEIIVVDQSSDYATQEALAEVLRDERVRYVKSATVGKGAALNEGLSLARSSYVVCTDDDCEAPAGWAGDMAALLESHPDVAVVFCAVVAPPYDDSVGYVPQYRPSRDRMVRSPLAGFRHRGLGAGMAVRRDVLLSLGGVDESFGPGARFPSADDWDVSVRTMLRGWATFETASLEVVHHGFRTFDEGKAHTTRDWFALGAAAAKPVRAGQLHMIALAVGVTVNDAVVPMLRDLWSLRRPRGVRRLTSFSRGYVRGLMTPVDRRTLKYRTPCGRSAREG